MTTAFVLSALSSSVGAHEWTAELRTRVLASQPFSVEETVGTRLNILPWAHTQLGARVGQSDRGIETFQYAGEFQVEPTDWFANRARLLVWNQPADHISSTAFLLSGQLTAGIAEWLRPWIQFGIYRRFHHFGGFSFLPFTRSVSVADGDWIAEIGFRGRVAAEWSYRLFLSTFEPDLEVYRLNYPYLQISLEHEMKDPLSTLVLYVRNQRLLGFGRSDGWVMGIRVGASL